MGRWTQQDPLDQLANPREANRYAYAAGDPANVVDPTGMIGFEDLVARFHKYVESPLLAIGFTSGGVGVFAACIGAAGWTGVGVVACGRGGATMTTIGLAYGYVTYREWTGDH